MPSSSDESLDGMTLKELKELATRRGLKQPGVGWPKCCPPTGNKPDIIVALRRLDYAAGPQEPKSAASRATASSLDVTDSPPAAPPTTSSRGSRLLPKTPQLAVDADQPASVLQDARYVAFDFETTGLGKTAEIRVVQIGAQALDAALRPVDRFVRFVNPSMPIQPSAVLVHGIDDARVSGEATWAEVGAAFNEWMDRVRGGVDAPLTLLAHNGKRYDARIMCFEHFRHGLRLPSGARHADTIDVLKRVLPGRDNYKLGEVHGDLLGRELENAHDAMADVDGMCALLRHLGADTVGAAADKVGEPLDAIARRCKLTPMPSCTAAAA